VARARAGREEHREQDRHEEHGGAEVGLPHHEEERDHRQEERAREAASISKARSLTAREAAVLVLSGRPQEDPASPLKDC